MGSQGFPSPGARPNERFQLPPQEGALARQCREFHRPGQVSTRLLGAADLRREDTPDGMMIK